jgi:hypothetical protein
MEVSDADLPNQVPALRKAHADDMAAGRLGMIEFEVPDDRSERFVRTGVDPSGIVMPFALDPRKKEQPGRDADAGAEFPEKAELLEPAELHANSRECGHQTTTGR